MVPREHQGTKALHKTGKTRSATAHQRCAGGCRYGPMDHAPAAEHGLPGIGVGSRRNRHPRRKCGDTHKWSSRQCIAHAKACACVEQWRRDRL